MGRGVEGGVVDSRPGAPVDKGGRHAVDGARGLGRLVRPAPV